MAGEAISGSVPGVASSERYVDLPSEPLLRPLCGLLDVVAIRSADDEQVDVVRHWPGLSVVPRCPGSVDHQLFDFVHGAELLGDHQRWPEGHEHQLRERTDIRIGLIGGQQLRPANGFDPNQLDFLQSPHFRGDRRVGMTGSVRELVDGPRPSGVDQDESKQLPLEA